MAEATVTENAEFVMRALRKYVVWRAVSEEADGSRTPATRGVIASLAAVPGAGNLEQEVANAWKLLSKEAPGIIAKRIEETFPSAEGALNMALRHQPFDVDIEKVAQYLDPRLSAEALGARRSAIAVAGAGALLLAFPDPNASFSGFGAQVSTGPMLAAAILFVLLYLSVSLYLETRSARIQQAHAERLMDSLAGPLITARAMLIAAAPVLAEESAGAARVWLRGADDRLRTHLSRRRRGKLKQVWIYNLPYLFVVCVGSLAVYRILTGFPVSALKPDEARRTADALEDLVIVAGELQHTLEEGCLQRANLLTPALQDDARPTEGAQHPGVRAETP